MAISIPTSAITVNGREAEVVPLTNICRTIAVRMQRRFPESLHGAPTFDVDMTEMENTGKRFR